MNHYFLIGNTHFDPVWLWTWDEAMASVRATFGSVLERMREYDGFIYSFAAPPVFEWIRHTDPRMFAEIKQLVADGRWELADGWWVQADCYAACEESYIRQGLYGQRYLKEHFNLYAETVFNIDSFGHSPVLPQIMSKSGIKYYCFSRPENRHIKLDDSCFLWRSPDGSTVLAYRADCSYMQDVREAADTLAKNKNGEIMLIYGVTDHGGAPTKRSIQDIRDSDDMEFSTVANVFRRQSDTRSVVSEELITGDFGPYSNCTVIKKDNARAEYAVLNAERASVFACRNNRHELTQCWKDILFNQFHDILGGASIKQAYVDARDMHGRAISTANEITHFCLQSITKDIGMPGKNPDNAWNAVIWNLNDGNYDGYIEAEVQWAHEFPWYSGAVVLEDSDGVRYPAQNIMERSVIPGFRSRFVWKADIPPMGYKTFKVVCSGGEARRIEDKNADPTCINTRYYRYDISKEDGALSVYDNIKDCTIGCNMLTPVCYSDTGDTWCFNINGYGAKSGCFKPEKMMITESGIHRTTVKCVSRFSDSIAEVYYTFYKNEHYFDLQYRINWNEAHTVFKLELNGSDTLEAGVPGGSVIRGGGEADMPMHKWMKTDKITLITDSVFSYGMHDGIIGLTLLRSPIFGDLRISDIDLNDDYPIMEQGIHEGKIRIFLNAEAEVDLFCNPCIVIAEANHEGTLPPVKSYASVREKGVRITAIKHCEDSSGIIVRIRDYTGTDRNITLTLPDADYYADLSAYEIKTLKIDTNRHIITVVNLLEDEQ
ncbi:MAG: glycoside hydrolase family 38 C-terminal domain-containing protein [Eubacteriales bacterium]|nr:glycoside hydrolase family 38 C-terminal domain-containing protein [Eubacteriales bacterium]